MSGTRNYRNEPKRSNRDVTADVDGDVEVYLGRFRYHTWNHGIPGCPQVIGSGDVVTLGEAADEGIRPCKKCSPVDWQAEPEGGRIV